MAKRTPKPPKRNKPGAPSDQRQKLLIEFRRKKRDLLAQLPAMWEALTDDKGKLDLTALTEKVAKKIREGDVINEYELAKALVDTADRRMRPQPVKDAQGTLSFYDPTAYIPIAPRERRRMAEATKDDIAAWQAIDDAEFEASRLAHTGKTTWRFSLLTVWRPDEKTLDKVMARLDREKAQSDGMTG